MRRDRDHASEERKRTDSREPDNEHCPGHDLSRCRADRVVTVRSVSECGDGRKRQDSPHGEHAKVTHAVLTSPAVRGISADWCVALVGRSRRSDVETRPSPSMVITPILPRAHRRDQRFWPRHSSSAARYSCLISTPPSPVAAPTGSRNHTAQSQPHRRRVGRRRRRAGVGNRFAPKVTKANLSTTRSR